MNCSPQIDWSPEFSHRNCKHCILCRPKRYSFDLSDLSLDVRRRSHNHQPLWNQWHDWQSIQHDSLSHRKCHRWCRQTDDNVTIDTRQQFMQSENDSLTLEIRNRAITKLSLAINNRQYLHLAAQKPQINSNNRAINRCNSSQNSINFTTRKIFVFNLYCGVKQKQIVKTRFKHFNSMFWVVTTKLYTIFFSASSLVRSIFRRTIGFFQANLTFNRNFKWLSIEFTAAINVRQRARG